MYEALTLLWLRSEERYVHPGERLALDDATSAALIERGLLTTVAEDPAPAPLTEETPSDGTNHRRVQRA